MKIIKLGTPPEKRLVQFTCKNCKSELEAMQSEGRWESDYRNNSWTVFKCPVCGMSCWVEP